MDTIGQDDWQPCQQGELSSLVTSLRKRRDRRQFLRIAGGTAGTLAVLLLGWRVAVRPPAKRGYRGPVYAGIACADVKEAARELVRGELSEPKSRTIKAHLALCGSCRAFVESLAEEMSA